MTIKHAWLAVIIFALCNLSHALEFEVWEHAKQFSADLEKLDSLYREITYGENANDDWNRLIDAEPMIRHLNTLSLSIIMLESMERQQSTDFDKRQFTKNKLILYAYYSAELKELQTGLTRLWGQCETVQGTRICEMASNIAKQLKTHTDADLKPRPAATAP